MKRNAYLRALDDVEAAIEGLPHHTEYVDDGYYGNEVVNRENVFVLIRKLRAAAHTRQEGK